MVEAAPAGPFKLVILPRTRNGLDRAGLRRHLETVHGPLVMAEPDVSGWFVGYVHHYTQDTALVPLLEDRDAVTFIRFADLAASAASKDSPGYRERVGPDEDNFRERDGSVALSAREWPVLAGADDAPRKLFVFRRTAVTELGDWAAALAGLAARHDLQGAATNTVRGLDGAFPFTQFDEIGLRAGADPAAVAAALEELAGPALQAAETRLLLTEPVRFI